MCLKSKPFSLNACFLMAAFGLLPNLMPIGTNHRNTDQTSSIMIDFFFLNILSDQFFKDPWQ